MVREQWATRAGFILAAVGSAVGLGNVWRFPFQVGQEGGSAFLVVYLLFVLLIGLPAILVEFVIGRRSKRNPITAFRRLGYPGWTFVGTIGVFTGFVILSYYSVAAGWVVRYTVASATGAYFADPGAYFAAAADGLPALAFHTLFVLATASIVGSGVRRGIELAVKVMVPAIVVVLVGLAAYAYTLDGAAAGYAYYLSLDVDVLAAEWQSILPAAAGQAFFTLSLGMGVMITYASYLGEDRNLAVDGGIIAAVDTLVAVLAGLVIFPVLFTLGAEPGAGGAGELFVGVGGAFATVPFGEVVGVLFFGTVTIAALSSAISILEVIVSYLLDTFDVDRRTATAAAAGTSYLFGIPAALSVDVLEALDLITGQFLLPLGMALMVVFVGWVYRDAVDELERGVDARRPVAKLWLWHVRTVILAVVVVTLAFGVASLGCELGLERACDVSGGG